MHIIEVTPAPCNICGKGNTADARGDRPRFVDFERHINWNDPLILCEDCVAQAGGLVGMASNEVLATMNRQLRDKDKELHELKAEMDNRPRRAKRLGITFDPVEV